MTVEINYVTDPACISSWGAEPVVRRLQWEFGDGVRFRPVMGGLARSFGPDYRDAEGSIGAGASWQTDLAAHWLVVTAETGMPCDPRIWTENPISSTYPAGMAVRAGFEQGYEPGMTFLRRLREGLICERQRLETLDTLTAQAAAAGLDAERFRIDAASHATVEAFGADLDRARMVDDPRIPASSLRRTEGGRRRLVMPTMHFGQPGDSEPKPVYGLSPYSEYRAAAIAAGAKPDTESRPTVGEAVNRFGRLATRELEELTGSPGPVLRAELWGLAREWRLRPVEVLIGELWDPAG